MENLFSLSRSPLRAGELARQFDTGMIYYFVAVMNFPLTFRGTAKSDEPFNLHGESPQDVALLLVRYLSDLPEPLCTFVLYYNFVQLEGV